MSEFHLVDSHIDILNEIGRWKVIHLRGLYNLHKSGVRYPSFCRQIKRLENEGFIRSILGSNKRKIITLTRRGAEVCPYATRFDDGVDSFNHDLITTHIVTKLIEYKHFKAGQVECFGRGLDVEPDGIIFGQKNEKEYSLAIEVELHQKSRTRLVSKLIKYSNSMFYSYVIYIINKESTFRFYRTVLGQMDHDVGDKVILLLDTELKSTCFNYLDALCFFQNKNLSFENIFGE